MKFKLTENIMEKILDKFGLEPEDKQDYFLVNCPACGKKEAFIYKNKEWIICSRRNKCAFTTSIWNLSKEILQGKEIFSLFAKEYGNSNLKAIDFVDKSDKVEELPKGLTFFAESKPGMIRNRAYNYLKNRGVSKEVINEFGYIYNPGSRFHQTIFIPFYENRRLVYFITRDYTEKNKYRYINPKTANSRYFIYNIDKIEEKGTVFIFEGVFDAISLKKQVGTAMLSDTLCKEQAIKIIDKIPSKIVFVPDNDEAGKKSLNKNIKQLLKYRPPSVKFDIYVYYIKEEAKDFNESGKDYINIEECELWSDNPLKLIKWQRNKLF